MRREMNYFLLRFCESSFFPSRLFVCSYSHSHYTGTCTLILLGEDSNESSKPQSIFCQLNVMPIPLEEIFAELLTFCS